MVGTIVLVIIALVITYMFTLGGHRIHRTPPTRKGGRARYTRHRVTREQQYRRSRLVRVEGRGRPHPPLSPDKIRQLKALAVQAEVHESCGHPVSPEGRRARNVLKARGIPPSMWGK